MPPLTSRRWLQMLALLCLCLHILPVWLNHFFVTGDGPSHLYNARVLLDLIRQKDWDFYQTFYGWNRNFDPNWMSHILLAGLQSFLPAWLAEKVYLTGYILVFATGFWRLGRQIGPSGELMALLALPLVYQYPLMMGFYNFTLSLGLWFWVVSCWISWRAHLTPLRRLLLSVLVLLLFFTHPVGLVFALISIALYEITAISLEPGLALRARWEHLLKMTIEGSVVALPSLMLLAAYLYRRPGASSPNPETFHRLFHDMIELTTLRSYFTEEGYWALAYAVAGGLVLVVFVGSRLWKRHWVAGDAFMLVFGITLLLYFKQPGGFAGAGVLPIRLQALPWIGAFLWMATAQWSPRWQLIAAIPAAVLMTALLVLRLPVQQQASQAAEEYQTAVSAIPPRQVVLPLSYSHNGKNLDGSQIAKRIWLFMHGGDYMGVSKPLILLGNYEANTGYFPIMWRHQINPFVYLSTQEGIEFQPPSVDIPGYAEKARWGRVDYVVTWCMDSTVMDHPYTQLTMKQLTEDFDEIFTTKHGRARVYRKKGLGPEGYVGIPEKSL
ncbi:MAG: hypothetical protein SF053_18195 [Bacteroidia bacterium]|nr:hypothetical protein [Bacteroidia bacterium]